jgi:HD-GYP domain-containing protein (c-di-GMP phosphodiesterase class II)/DNA-binding CsgD family transcriptional regulator
MSVLYTDDEEHADVRVLDAAKALAFVGDLSMGQPTDHSLRTAWLAAQLATEAGLGTAQCDVAKNVSLLRWSGCTANAPGFAELIGDDIAGREAMLARRPGSPVAAVVARDAGESIRRLAHIHCEVSGEVARMLTLDNDTEVALRHIFESYDGHGWPNHVAGDRVPPTVFAVSLAGDLEILGRVYGLDQALEMIAKDAQGRYPGELVGLVVRRGRQWHEALTHDVPADYDNFLTTDKTLQLTSPELIADVIDLKLPWMTQYSRRVAAAAALGGRRLGLDASTQRRVYRAGLIHGMGRASVPNSVWNTPGKLSASEWEKVRLVPYWTMRAGKNIGALLPEAELASFAYERIDGSGYFRSLGGAGMSIEARVLAAAAAWIALQSPRPWRSALGVDEATSRLGEEARGGRFDADAVAALGLLAGDVGQGTSTGVVGGIPGGTAGVHASGFGRGGPDGTPSRLKTVTLSARETDVLRHISQGASNKEVARVLDISLSTVRTHVESTFRKLECSTRAAATLKASAMGLL